MGLISNIGTLLKAKMPAQAAQSGVALESIGYSGAPPANEREAIYPNWFFSARLGQPRSVDINLIRDLSNSTWVQMVLNSFKKQISTIEWDIVNDDPEDEADRSADIKVIKDFLKKINDSGQDVGCLNSELITDISVIDAGIVNYVFSTDSYVVGQVPVYDAWGRITNHEEGVILKPLGQRELTKIKSVDGGTMLKQVDIHKNLLAYWQYSFKHPRMNPTRFEKDEISYMLMNARTYDVYGFSPVQSIQQVLELLIQGTRYNKDLYTNNAIPDVLISLPKLDVKELEKLKRRWNNSYRGKPHQIGFINWMIDKVHKLNDSNRDLEWLDGQKWYSEIVFAVFGVSPTEAGFFQNSNRSNDEGQERVTIRNALKPYMHMLEQMHTSKTITEILQKEDHGLRFKFLPRDHTAEKIEFEQDVKELELGAMTINEYRKKKGKEPVEWGDEPLRRPFDPSNSFSNFAGDSNFPPRDSNQNSPLPVDESASNANKSTFITSFKEVSAGDDLVDEAEGYSDFLSKTFDRFEKKVLAAVDKINKADKSINKAFGGFIAELFNVVNTVKFAAEVRKYLKKDLLAGMESAEKETGMDIGFTQSYDDHLNKLQAQQIDGYMINGKKWFGIKGVTKEIQASIIKVVQQKLTEDATLDDIKAAVKQQFAVFTDWRAEMIARTETNRVINEGKIIGYKETKIPGKMVWRAAMDDRTSDVCRRLNGRKADISGTFRDEVTNIEYTSPPAHPNCRSVIAFVPD